MKLFCFKKINFSIERVSLIKIGMKNNELIGLSEIWDEIIRMLFRVQIKFFLEFEGKEENEEEQR